MRLTLKQGQQGIFSAAGTFQRCNRIRAPTCLIAAVPTALWTHTERCWQSDTKLASIRRLCRERDTQLVLCCLEIK